MMFSPEPWKRMKCVDSDALTLYIVDANGDGVTTNWTRWEAFGTTIGSATTTVGSVSAATVPTRCAEPTVVGKVSYRGWSGGNTDIPVSGRDYSGLTRALPCVWLRRFDVAGGFQF